MKLKHAIALAAARALPACGHPVVMQNPETGEVAQCTNESWLWGSVGQSLAIEKCAEAYERAGWRRV
jgi:hypothetical protein